MKILLAEREEGNLDQIAEALKGEGYDITVVTDGRVLYEILEAGIGDLLILEDLPNLTRTDMVNQIRREMRKPENLAIIVLYSDEEPIPEFPPEYEVFRFRRDRVPGDSFLKTIRSIAENPRE